MLGTLVIEETGTLVVLVLQRTGSFVIEETGNLVVLVIEETKVLVVTMIGDTRQGMEYQLQQQHYTPYTGLVSILLQGGGGIISCIRH